MVSRAANVLAAIPLNFRALDDPPDLIHRVGME
jgi:hypothetical protein